MRNRLGLLLAPSLWNEGTTLDTFAGIPRNNRKKAASQRELEAERDARRQALSEQERSAGEEVDAHKATHFCQNRDATIAGCVSETCLRTLSEKAV